MSLLRAIVGLRDRRDFGPVPQDVIRRSSLGFRITEETALRYTTFFRCIDLISSTIAQLPRGTFVGEGPTRKPIPRPTWVRTPAGAMMWGEWAGQLLVSKLMRGNAIGRVLDVDGLGQPLVIDPIHPDHVFIYRDRTTGRAVYDVRGVGKLDRWPLGDIVHVPGMMLPGAVSGLSPVSYAASTIGTALAAEEYDRRFFEESAIPPGALNVPQEISKEEAKALKAEFVEAHGHGNREPAVFSGGVSFEKLSISPSEALFIETLKADDARIAGFFGVPLHMVGLGDMQSNWGTGLEENALQFITYTIGQHLNAFEQVFTSLLPADRYFKFNVAGLLRGRLAERYAAYITGRQGGWLNIDDIRALEDMPPLPDAMGQDYLMPLNYSAIPPGGAIAALPPPPTPTAPVTPPG